MIFDTFFLVTSYILPNCRWKAHSTARARKRFGCWLSYWSKDFMTSEDNWIHFGITSTQSSTFIERERVNLIFLPSQFSCGHKSEFKITFVISQVHILPWNNRVFLGIQPLFIQMTQHSFHCGCCMEWLFWMDFQRMAFSTAQVAYVFERMPIC